MYDSDRDRYILSRKNEFTYKHFEAEAALEGTKYSSTKSKIRKTSYIFDYKSLYII